MATLTIKYARRSASPFLGTRSQEPKASADCPQTGQGKPALLLRAGGRARLSNDGAGLCSFSINSGHWAYQSVPTPTGCWRRRRYSSTRGIGTGLVPGMSVSRK